MMSVLSEEQRRLYKSAAQTLSGSDRQAFLAVLEERPLRPIPRCCSPKRLRKRVDYGHNERWQRAHFYLSGKSGSNTYSATLFSPPMRKVELRAHLKKSVSTLREFNSHEQLLNGVVNDGVM